jgi:hypothetical protein
MRSTARHLFPITLCIAMALLLNGCSLSARQSASPQLTVATPDQDHTRAEQRWWRACFRLPFDKAQRPDWSMDALLAEQVAAPSLRRHAGKIRLWRFHRRAAQDASGHQFSLLFYSDKTTASQLFSELQEHPLTNELTATKQPTQLLAPCGGDRNQDAIEASSDPRWDPRLQKAWPHFIMGVSAHWLALIEEVGREIPLEGNDRVALLKRYQRIQKEIDTIWRADGQHAYLHHLNALFGYQPLLMRY